MPKKTLQMIREEMSIAGSPDKLMSIMKNLEFVMKKVDKTNAAELINLEFVMELLLKKSRTWKRSYTRRTGQHI